MSFLEVAPSLPRSLVLTAIKRRRCSVELLLFSGYRGRWRVKCGNITEKLIEIQRLMAYLTKKQSGGSPLPTTLIHYLLSITFFVRQEKGGS